MRKILTITFIFISLSLGATKWYLSPSGNDISGDGSIGSPYFTLEKAWTVASAGDTIYMRGGTYEYSKSQELTGLSGTSGNYVNVCAYPDEIPVITKATTYTWSGILKSGIYLVGDYIYMKRLEITGFEQETNANYFGLAARNSSHCKFEMLNVHHNGMGMIIYDNSSTGNLILNCDFHHNYDPLTDPDIYGNADGLDVGNSTNSSAINYIEGCRFWNNSDDGLDLWGHEGKVYIENCWAWHNGYREDSVTFGGDGNGMKLGVVTTGSQYHMRFIYNCIAADNRDMGFSQNVWNGITPMPCVVYNNFAYKNGIGKGLGFQFGNAGQGIDVNIFRNNTGYLNYNNINISCEEWDINDHNSWNGSVTINSSDFTSLDTDLLATARNADGSLPFTNFSSLVEGSDLIGAGINVGTERDGYGNLWNDPPSMGPFEYESGEPPSGNTFAKDKTGKFMKDKTGKLMMIIQ